jgi:transposase InsO family protein
LEGVETLSLYKSEAQKELCDLIEQLGALTRWKVRYFHSDEGDEFIATELKDYFHMKGITHEMSAPYTPQQNGVAKHFNQTTTKKPLMMLKHAGMTDGFWPDAHLYASDA